MDATTSGQKRVSDLTAAYHAAIVAASKELMRTHPALVEWIDNRARSGGLRIHPTYGLKLIELEAMLRFIQPQTIVELGSGATTLVIDQYAEITGCVAYTVDDPQWMISEDLSSVHKWSTSAIHRDESVQYVSYPEIGRIDLLYVDGPSLEGGLGGDAAWLAGDGDVMHILWDYRVKDVHAFMAAHGQRYTLEPSPAYCQEYRGSWVASRTKHHSWARSAT